MSRHPFDAALGTLRQLADAYYPRNRKTIILVFPADADPAGFVCPPGCVCVHVPAAADIPEPDIPVGTVKMAGCGVAVIATLLQLRGRPAQAAEIVEILRDSEEFTAFSLSSVEKTLAELVATGLVRNPVNARPRGYVLAE